jgi:hypothetical protein
LGVVAAIARKSSQIREPASVAGFVHACLDRADNPGLVVEFIGALMSAVALRKLRGHMVAQVARDGIGNWGPNDSLGSNWGPKTLNL